jgi:1,4-dihydroxy-2-naphthoate octaprenyltransferase
MADEIIVHAWNPNKIYLLLITAFLFGLGIVMMMLALETDFSPPFFVVVLGLIIPPILIFVSIFYYVKKDPFTIDNSGLRGKKSFYSLESSHINT